ncbi:M14 family metallopeptidase [Sphingomonas sp.]|uniref:M14 family metallopeptidase n=1 Tax=Sphingomonas sp. TaxID=28214 RepID=UPI003B0095CF
MRITVSAALDSGNIRVLGIDDDRVTLEISPDRQSDFYQWFHFRVLGARGRRLTYEIVNAGGAAFPGGWTDYRACWSTDGATWRRVADTSYADGTLRFAHEAAGDEVRFAYFAPYSTERHLALVARAAASPGVTLETLGRTLDGREIECLTLGEGPLSVWFFCRQHPGETMAEWWADGALTVLTDPDHAIARSLRRKATFRIVPNMNPDGSARGHLRTNAAGVNLNREWHAPSDDRSPEVKAVLAAMDATGVDFAIDAHGDETIPYVFIAGFEGIPSLTERQTRLYRAYSDALVRRTPDFQSKHGYPSSQPGKGNLSMATNQVAERFGAVAMTLEMPFKDNDDLPDPDFGWSPGRSMRLAEACLAALHDVIGEF